MKSMEFKTARQILFERVDVIDDAYVEWIEEAMKDYLLDFHEWYNNHHVDKIEHSSLIEYLKETNGV